MSDSLHYFPDITFEDETLEANRPVMDMVLEYIDDILRIERKVLQ